MIYANTDLMIPGTISRLLLLLFPLSPSEATEPSESTPPYQHSDPARTSNASHPGSHSDLSRSRYSLLQQMRSTTPIHTLLMNRNVLSMKELHSTGSGKSR